MFRVITWLFGPCYAWQQSFEYSNAYYNLPGLIIEAAGGGLKYGKLIYEDTES